MVQIKTSDEEQGQAAQLDLPIPPSIARYDAERLRRELDLVTPATFAAALGVSEQTLAAWRSDKTGPDYVKLGKSVFYRRKELKTWVKSNVLDSRSGEVKPALVEGIAERIVA